MENATKSNIKSKAKDNLKQVKSKRFKDAKRKSRSPSPDKNKDSHSIIEKVVNQTEQVLFDL